MNVIQLLLHDLRVWWLWSGILLGVIGGGILLALRWLKPAESTKVMFTQSPAPTPDTTPQNIQQPKKKA